MAATAKGITVVEAAGNGNQKLDLAIFNGTGLQKDSGAIVVGAGIPPTNDFDTDSAYASIGVPRSRIWFSNYGKIVNVHAWGWHVTTLGYGDAQGGASETTGTRCASRARPAPRHRHRGRRVSAGASQVEERRPDDSGQGQKDLDGDGNAAGSRAGRAADPEHRADAESPKGDGAGVRMGGRSDPRGPSAEGRQRPAHHRLHAEGRVVVRHEAAHLQVRTGRDILAPRRSYEGQPDRLQSAQPRPRGCQEARQARTSPAALHAARSAGWRAAGDVPAHGQGMAASRRGPCHAGGEPPRARSDTRAASPQG